MWEPCHKFVGTKLASSAPTLFSLSPKTQSLNSRGLCSFPTHRCSWTTRSLQASGTPALMQHTTPWARRPQRHTHAHTYGGAWHLTATGHCRRLAPRPPRRQLASTPPSRRQHPRRSNDHGRDGLGPVAARLGRAVVPQQLCKVVEGAQPVAGLEGGHPGDGGHHVQTLCGGRRARFVCAAPACQPNRPACTGRRRPSRSGMCALECQSYLVRSTVRAMHSQCTRGAGAHAGTAMGAPA